MASEEASPLSSKTVKLSVGCHCGNAKYTHDVQPSAFPLKSCICHCSDCRYSTGQLYANFVSIGRTGKKSLKPDISNLSTYKLSKTVNRHFCPRCGAGVCIVDENTYMEWSGGLLDKSQGLLDRFQLFVGPTLDGGASIWLPKQIGGLEVKRFLGTTAGTEADDKLLERMENVLSPAANSKRLFAKCHCENIQFFITRGTGETPLGATGAKTERLDSYDACLCMCNSCRLCSGVDISFWASVPADNIFQPDGKKFDIDTAALTHYDSSTGVHRDFCKTCGAVVFFRKDNKNPQIWDISVGLFRDITVRIEGWFKWQEKVDFVEDATDQELAELLMKTL